jgi:hypothetical protein
MIRLIVRSPRPGLRESVSSRKIHITGVAVFRAGLKNGNSRVVALTL